VDVLLHAAQFLESERSTADLFGHATVDEAIRLATEAKVGTLVLFHHAPARTDAQLDALACELAARCRWSSPRRAEHRHSGLISGNAE